MIQSSQNSRIKLARAIAGRTKERRQADAFLAEGVRLVEEASAAGWPFRYALYSDDLSDRGRKLVKQLQDQKIKVEQVESKLLRSVSDTETSQGLLAVLNDFTIPIPDSPNFVFIPDAIRDPGNLGALLRTADAGGAQAVLIPPETADPFAPKVVRAGMGAHFRLPLHLMSWVEISQFIHSSNLKVYLADMDGQSCWETDLRQPLALIVGGEVKGASEHARNLANRLIGIPMLGKTESLNAAAAGSILMFEVRRQRAHS